MKERCSKEFGESGREGCCPMSRLIDGKERQGEKTDARADECRVCERCGSFAGSDEADELARAVGIMFSLALAHLYISFALILLNYRLQCPQLLRLISPMSFRLPDSVLFDPAHSFPFGGGPLFSIVSLARRFNRLP